MLRLSLRSHLRNKRFAVLAILSLSIAMALNITMYSVVDSLINPRLDMHQPERLYSLGYMGDYKGRMTDIEKLESMRSVRSFEAFGGGVRNFSGEESNIVEQGTTVHDARVRTVTDNFFALLGVRPLAGRLLTPNDAVAEPRPIVISERLWKQFFPDRLRLDTATLVLGGEPRPVVGVLGYASDFPGAFTDIWQLPRPTQPLAARVSWNIVRLREGVSEVEAKVELRQLADRWAAAAGELPKDVDFRLRPSIGEPFQFQAFHVAMMGAVAMVLLVACVNLANLQLARGIGRARELATRTAVGASRADLITQLLLESMWLALAGLLIGLLLTAWGMQLVETSVPETLSDYVVRPQVTWRLFAFAAAGTLVCLVAVGLIPAIRVSRVDIHSAIKAGSGTGRTTRARQGYGGLVVVQIALALALMVGSGLLLKSAASLYGLDIPEQYERTLHGFYRVSPPGTQNREYWTTRSVAEQQRRLNDTRRVADVGAHVLSRIRALPEVETAATATWRRPVGMTISLEDAGGKAREVVTGLFSYMLVSSEFPRVAGVELHKGRLFADGEFAEPLVIIDDRTARYLWPGQDAVGKHLKLGRDSSRAPWLAVIGVVRYRNFWSPFDRANQTERIAASMGAVMVLNGADSAVVGSGTNVQLLVRARSEAGIQKLPYALRRAIAEPAAGIGMRFALTWRQATRLDYLRERQNFVAGLFAIFAAIALAVAALGVYAIISHSVSQRTREIGVRMALGASTADVRRSVLKEGNILALSGIAVGLILASQTVGLLQAFLRSEDDRFNSPFFALVALVLFAVALVASWIPARRAMRINPVEALRND